MIATLPSAATGGRDIEAHAMLPETDVTRVRQWVETRNDRLPERAVGQIRYELDVESRSLTIMECRPPWRTDMGSEWTRFPIARLRYTKTRNEWAIDWRDRNLRFHRYDLAEPSTDVQPLLDEVDRDPTAIFWG